MAVGNYLRVTAKQMQKHEETVIRHVWKLIGWAEQDGRLAADMARQGSVEQSGWLARHAAHNYFLADRHLDNLLGMYT